ncbi:unnamed protein product [Effrenium voratum]|uniref:SnoaL-like domain-containing protein n=1 Tax=Effrenium voratum TaxID=2562239 RepID=A0AA36MFQ9_9DINO|nr:unnamed protein product [Effrenium voratum]
MDAHRDYLALVTAFYEDLWNKADDEALRRILAPEVQFKGSTECQVRCGPEAFRDYRNAIRSTLANYTCTILDVTFSTQSVSYSDVLGAFAVDATTPHCVARVKFSGRHVAAFHVPPLNAFEATGAELSWLGVAYFFFSGSQIRGVWVMGDVAAIYEQSWTAVANGSTGDLRQATRYAVNAWGGVLMRGHDCCVLLAAPYCYAQKTDIFDFAIPVLVLFFILLFLCVSSKSCALWLKQLGKKVPEEPYHPKEPLVATPQSALDLEQKLLAIWEASCLGGKGDPNKALPKSREWGRAAASLFASIKLGFDFQADSVCNQFEHLISLWRSHAAVVTDRAVQDAYVNRWRWSSGSWSEAATEPTRMDINGTKALQRAAADCEPELLQDALEDLHRDLLEGLHQWRARLSAYPELEVRWEERRMLGG